MRDDGGVDLLQLAHTLAPAYVATGKVGALIAAGSAARGRADEYSDLELDVYWSAPPTDADRRGVVQAVDGRLTRLWDYEPDEGEWAEEFTLHQHDIGISGFEVTWVDHLITDVIDRCNADPAWQMRLSAIADGVVLYDDGHVDAWRARIATYPDSLARAVISSYLDPGRLGSWHQRHALLARGDLPLLRSLTTRIPVIVLGALSGLNRVPIEHHAFKWAAATIDRLTVAPKDLRNRLWRAMDQDVATAVAELDSLLLETLDVIDMHLPNAGTGPMRSALENVRSRQHT